MSNIINESYLYPEFCHIGFENEVLEACIAEAEKDYGKPEYSEYMKCELVALSLIKSIHSLENQELRFPYAQKLLKPLAEIHFITKIFFTEFFKDPILFENKDHRCQLAKEFFKINFCASVENFAEFRLANIEDKIEVLMEALEIPHFGELKFLNFFEDDKILCTPEFDTIDEANPGYCDQISTALYLKIDYLKNQTRFQQTKSASKGVC